MGVEPDMLTRPLGLPWPKGVQVTRRDTLLALLMLGTGAGAAPLVTLAQAQTKARRIGFLTPRSRPSPPDRDAFSDAFMQGMRELGYVEGKNVVIEWRYADGNYKSLPDLAAELARMDLEVIVTYGTAAGQALKKATSSIPIVVAAAVDLPPFTGRRPRTSTRSSRGQSPLICPSGSPPGSSWASASRPPRHSR
jgi:ABC transporter substrate binding protein